MPKHDSDAYLARKRAFQQFLTLYGRLPVLEALQEPGVTAKRLHLANSNKPARVLDDIIAAATAQGAEVLYHDRLALSRISRNAKQDQGVALDIQAAGFREFEAETHCREGGEFIALDRITNPQNLGMIVRSVCASGIRGLILPRKGCAKLDALVIKASAGTLFRTPVFRCETLEDALSAAAAQQTRIAALELDAKHALSALPPAHARIFVLGNESEGVSKAVHALCSEHVRIPMHNNVESLNVAVTASLIALRHQL